MPEPTFKKKVLFDHLKAAGLPHTAPNVIYRYENMVCPEHKQPFLISKRDLENRRIYTQADIEGITKAFKEGWFDKHWHWPPLATRSKKRA